MASLIEALEAAFGHYAAGRLAEADIICGRILDAAPQQAEALHLSGVIAGRRGDGATAVARLAAAVRLRPDNADILRHHIMALRATGDDAAAEQALPRLAPLDPADAAALAATAAAARRDGDANRTWRLQRRAARLDPTAEAVGQLTDDAWGAGQGDAAAAACRATLAHAPQLGRVWRFLGRELAGFLPAGAAERALWRAIRLLPDEPEAYDALWRIRRAAGLDTVYHSHEGQDALVHRMFFPDRRGGVFVDLGAYDGATWSNSLFFEREMGWGGLCVEASPARHADYLRNGRTTPCANVAVGDRDGEAAFFEVVDGLTMMNGLVDLLNPGQQAFVESRSAATNVITVPLRRLDGLLVEHGIRHIDFLTIDVEGAEKSILQSLDADAFTIDVMCLESQRPDPELRALLDGRGYDFICRFEGGDEIFARRGLQRWG